MNAARTGSHTDRDAIRLGQAITETAVLVDRYRARCFWFFRSDWRPETAEAALRAITLLQRYGDREAFQAAAALRQCLSRDSNNISAG